MLFFLNVVIAYHMPEYSLRQTIHTYVVIVLLVGVHRKVYVSLNRNTKLLSISESPGPHVEFQAACS